MEPMEKLMQLFLLCGVGCLGLGIYGLSSSLLASIALPFSAIFLVMWYKIKYPTT